MMERLIFFGKIQDNMYKYFKDIRDVKGDFAEFGVFKGSSFKMLIAIARKQGKKIHGFDSFKGLTIPTKKDYVKGKIAGYPKGKFNTGGSQELRDELGKMGYKSDKDYYLWEGFIPNVFRDVPGDISFSFGFVDLDHYKPTKSALRWLFKRLEIGGIVLCDDYFPKKTHLASLAIHEFIEGNKRAKILESDNSQVLFKRIK